MDRKPVFLLLMAGPKFDLEWEFGQRLRGMSRFSSGYLVTTSSADRLLEVGDYQIAAIDLKAATTLLSRLRYVYMCARTLRQARKSGKPVDAIVTYDPLLTGAIGLMLARLYGAKLVCEVNGDYSAVTNYLHVRNPIARALRMRVAMALANYVLRRASGIKTLFLGQLQNLGVVPKASQTLRHFPSFVDTAAFRNLGDENVVLLVGFPFHVKGVDIAIAAFKKIADRHPEWTLKIMGYYPEQSQLQNAIGGAERIFHQRPVVHRKMNEHIGKCGILVLPSRTEAMGRVLVEAMAAGKPRVGTRVGGIPTVIDDGVDGLLVAAEDVDGLAAALDRLMSSGELRQRFGNAAAERAVREFSIETYLGNVEEFLGAVIKSS